MEFKTKMHIINGVLVIILITYLSYELFFGNNINILNNPINETINNSLTNATAIIRTCGGIK